MLDPGGQLAIALLSLIVCYALRRYLHVSRTRILPYPPGPPARPIIGNIMDIGIPNAWLKMTEYKEQYGDLVYLHGLGKSVLVLNSLKAITDLLEKRANKYSDRPVLVFGNDLIGMNRAFVFCDYGEEWRAQRKLAHVALGLAAVKDYVIMQEDIAAGLARDLLKTREDFHALIRLAAGRTVLAVTYGIWPDTAEDEFIILAEEVNRVCQKAAIPGAYLCDILPILKYAPPWVPFRRIAAYGRQLVEEVLNRPFEHVKQELKAGIAPPSMVQRLLTDPPENITNLDESLKGAAGSMYGAGAETTYSAVLTFVLAMALNPDKQRLAQVEIDRVVGTDRLPTIKDMPDLPYINAVIKEVMRWHPSVPLGVAHRSSEDDVYGGYFIPKSTVILPNVWFVIAFEPNEKYDPQAFLPERFLDASHPTVDPSLWAFGFGRRICPGRFLAENSLFIFIATLLSAFDICPPEKGDMKVQFKEFLISILEPFECRITPRSETKAHLVEIRAGQSTT
ncbi:cytochrome P450 [Obba rivulosa]|uniref:Cytochrome P450 n=1 Tax=Obba rivulosa TaxID=1052685 RepID=A0A8E2AVU3_9APHY|nr:cytochrome P450 [Obba rivulosa]